MNENWHYSTADGQSIGPVTLTELRELIRQGQLKPDDLVWHTTLGRWHPVSEVSQLRTSPPPIASPPPIVESAPRSRDRTSKARRKGRLPQTIIGGVLAFTLLVFALGFALARWNQPRTPAEHIAAAFNEAAGRRGLDPTVDISRVTITSAESDANDLRKISITVQNNSSASLGYAESWVEVRAKGRAVYFDAFHGNATIEGGVEPGEQRQLDIFAYDLKTPTLAEIDQGRYLTIELHIKTMVAKDGQLCQLKGESPPAVVNVEKWVQQQRTRQTSHDDQNVAKPLRDLETELDLSAEKQPWNLMSTPLGFSSEVPTNAAGIGDERYAKLLKHLGMTDEEFTAKADRPGWGMSISTNEDGTMEFKWLSPDTPLPRFDQLE